jgi:uncharacterized protein YjlB
VALLPAGVGHQPLGPVPDLLVIGADPPGRIRDLCRALAQERAAALSRIVRLPDPPDPVRGGALAIEPRAATGEGDR